jgi:hypothetical protein
MMGFRRPTRSGQMNWSSVVILGLFAVILGGVGIFFLVRYIYRSSVLSPFESSRNEFVSLRPQAGEPTNKPLKGNFIAIDVADNSFDHFYFDLPENLKATTPADVKTVVFLNWTKQQTHTYDPGNKPGYTHSCMVEVVDRETKTLLLRNNFVGGPPPASISGRSSSGEGPKPTDFIIAYLKGHMPP